MANTIYLLHGSDRYLIKSKTKNIIDEHKIDAFNVTHYDAEEQDIEAAVNDAATIPFMVEKKVVVVKNCVFLSTEDKKLKIEHHLNSLKRYMDHPSDTTVFILQAPYEKLDGRKAITKFVKDHSELIECKPIDAQNTRGWVNRQLGKHGISIDHDALDEFLKRVENNTEVLVNETGKLVLYAEDLGHIDLKTVQTVITKNIEDNVYEITNNLLVNNRSKALEIYHDLVMHSEDPIRILGILVSKYREILHTQTMLEHHYTKQQVADHFRATPGRTYYIMKNARSVKKNQVVEYLNALEKIDYKIKTGQVDKKIAVELFILGHV